LESLGGGSRFAHGVTRSKTPIPTRDPLELPGDNETGFPLAGKPKAARPGLGLTLRHDIHSFLTD
jgi:hypothetical protein